jgi:hypothetical protein
MALQLEMDTPAQTQKMEAASSSKMSETIYNTTWYILQDLNMIELVSN